MINPYLEQRLFELPLRPLLVEAEPNALPGLIALFIGAGLPPHNVVPQFAMFGLPPIPAKQIESINALPGVRIVHADLMSHVLVQFPGAGVFRMEDPSEWWPTSDSRQLLGAEQAFVQGEGGNPGDYRHRHRSDSRAVEGFPVGLHRELPGPGAGD